MFGMLDDNINGKLEMAELKGSIGNQIKPVFATLDANKDGALDQQEMAAAQNLMQRGRRAAAD
jgi:hypothetical protein